MPEESTLTGRQRLELAMLCDEVEQPGRSLTAKFADLIRYVATEGLTSDHFGRHDRSGNGLLHAVTAVGILRHPEDFDPGSLGHRALVAAGFVTHSGNDDPEAMA